MKCRWSVMFLFVCIRSFPQAQTCPANINFASSDLTHWFAYTGNNKNGNGPQAIEMRYDSTVSAPNGTIGAHFIREYNLPNVLGIQVITAPTTDLFGGFKTVPTINGYNYGYSIKLGSTAITRGNGPTNTGGGGYIRGVSYKINVPPGPASEPYTMTYAYAMVLENGTHVSSQQPLTSVTLTTPAGVVLCASPSYYLPTFNNVTEGGRGATLDSATAKANGFKVSPEFSPNANPDINGSGLQYLQDIWYKDWTEVTYDLGAYRGQQVSLTIEADNCVPGGHFSYAYVAIRNRCAGLAITGDSLICNNSIATYSVPTLDGATYHWNVPNSWTVISGEAGNILKVQSSTTGGTLSVHEKNSCADLTDTISINTLPSPVGGTLNGSTTVCEGNNISPLILVNYSGNIQNWLSSTDGNTWTPIQDTTTQFSADNLSQSTLYKVVVGKGNVCPADTSIPAAITVDKKSVGGQIDPPDAVICAGQSAGETLTLSGQNGAVQDWQYSTDGINWTNFAPAENNPVNTIKGITENTQYRTIVQNGVCPAETSSVVHIDFNPVSFPQASADPVDTTICYGTTASLNAWIDLGTSYAWSPGSATYSGVGSTPYHTASSVVPDSSGYYVLHVLNNGCPNPLLDSLHINVMPPVIVNAGRDTSVVIGQPLQFNATSSDPGPDNFFWEPATDLNNVFISDPVAIYNLNDSVIRYMVKATTPAGCSGIAFITVKVFKTKPDIFVPNAFTPGLSINTLFRPIPVGITSLDYFRIYNRLGQLVYSTSTIGKGWDGTLNGTPQNVGGYVWMVQGTDYAGNIISKKGTMVLIR
jgi:hypothetical protein